MTRHPIIVANWKMHTTYTDAMVLATSVKKGLEDIHHIEVIFCPPFPWLVPVAELIKNHPLAHLHLGAQNVYPEKEGAFTGEVSADMLKGIIRYGIVGHSERVRYFHEMPQFIGQKAASLLAAGITPIICIGEAHQTERSKKVVLNILQDVLQSIGKDQWSEVILAYEPVWAISTTDHSQPATGDYAQTICQAMREIIGSQTPILYGGSVDAKNIAEFLNQDDINGALVGGASLKAKEFLKICEIASEVH